MISMKWLKIIHEWRSWLSAGLLISATVAGRAEEPAATAGTITATTSVVSQYMFRGVRLGGAALQPAVEYTQGSWTVGVWGSVPLRDKVAGQSDPEIDPYASYRITLNEAMSLQPGFTLYTYPGAEPANGFYRMTFEPSLALNYTVHGITFTPKVYYDVVMEGPTYEFNVSYALPVKEIGSELDFYVTVGSYEWKSSLEDASPNVKGRGDYWSASVALPFQITARSKLIASVGYTEGSNNYFKQGSAPKQINTAAVGRGVATLSYAVTF